MLSCVTSRELRVLRGLHPDCLVIYVTVLRLCMDLATGLAGADPRFQISYGWMRSELSRPRNKKSKYPGRRASSITLKHLRVRLDEMQRAELIRKIPQRHRSDHLVFFLPLAFRGSIRPIEEGQTEGQRKQPDEGQRNNVKNQADTHHQGHAHNLSQGHDEGQYIRLGSDLIVSKKQKRSTQTEKARFASGSQSSPLPSCPHKKIIQLYREILPDLPGVADWTPSRQRMLRDSWQQFPDLDWWRGYFEAVSKNRYLMGKVNCFRASLAWLVNRDNIAEFRERKFDARR